MSLIILLISILTGFLSFIILTHSKSPLGRRLPTLYIKRIQLSPQICIKISGRIYHIHHWISLTVILVISIYIGEGLLAALFTKGFLVGGILQDLSFDPNWKKIVVRSDEEKKLS